MEIEERSRETYNKILQAGREVLNKKDYHEAVVEEIAHLAGVAKGTVFFYFKTKENLFKEIMLSLLDELNTSIEGILANVLPPLKKLKKIYDYYIEFNLRNMQILMSIRKQLLHVEPKVEEIKEKLSQLSRKILPLVEEMFKAGLIKKIAVSVDLTEVVSSMLLMYASAVSSMVFFYPDRVNELKEIFWEILLHGILNEDVSIEMLVFEK